MKDLENIPDDEKPKVVFDTEGENNLYFIKLAKSKSNQSNKFKKSTEKLKKIK